MVLSSINRVKYCGLDFDTHVDDGRTRLQVKFAADYNEFALAAMGMLLLDTVSYGLDTLSFYLDRRATEVYLSTARTRRAVARICRQLGYKMGGGVASSTDLAVYIPATAAKVFNVTISAGFKFAGPNGLVFEAGEAVSWSPAEQLLSTVKYVPVYEGETITETYSSNGTANQVFTISRVPSGKVVAAGSVRVWVDGASWQEVDFLEYEQTNQFEIGYNDDPATVRFGDGSAGTIPITGATIQLTYVATTGKAGSAARSTIQAAVTPLVIAGETITLVIDNPTRAAGGDDLETLDHAKAFAGKVFNSRKVAVTGPDYDALAGSYAHPLYGRVAVAKAISSRSAVTDLGLQDSLLTISGALQAPVDAIRAEIAAATISTGTLPQLLADAVWLDTQVTNIGASVTIINANIAAVVSGIRGNRNLSLDLDADFAQISLDVTNGKADVAASTATVGEKAAIDVHFDAIQAQVTAMLAKTATMRAAADAQVGAAGLIGDETNKIGETASSTQYDGSRCYIGEVNVTRADIVGLVGTYDPADPTVSTGLYRTFSYTLENAADTLDPSLGGTAAALVATALQEIADHVDAILSNDCQANLISVPILVRDAAGFYTEPSNGLISSLGAYLTARKEVTQTVEVVSGGKFLIFPVISCRLGMKPNFSLEQGRTATETVIDGVLKDRKFSVSLYLSDMEKLILQVEGVGFVNLSIDGYTTVGSSTVQTSKLDAEGNLIIESTEVITKTPGSVTVSPETAPASNS